MRKRLSLIPAALAMAVATAACGAVAGPNAANSSGATSPAASAPASSASSSSTPATSSSGPTGSSATGSSATSSAPLAWAALGTASPLWIAANRPGIAGAPSGNALDLAYCLSGGTAGIKVSHDGGQTWTTISTAGVVAATASTGYPVTATAAGAPACTSALADPAHPQTVYATFAAGKAKVSMPPVYNVPVYTTDGGTHWKVVQPPSGSGGGNFGQFTVTASGVAALFSLSGKAPAGGTPFAVAETVDGGATWHAGALSCPAQGPCLTWGPAASGIGSCAMDAYPQPVEASTDGGKSWAALPAPGGSPIPVLANGCSLNQLVALSSSRIALVANGTVEPQDALRVSSDGGQTWQQVTLPALPGQGTATEGLQMLPDGSLLAPVFTQLGSNQFANKLALLKPGAKSWCTVPGVTISGANTNQASVQVADSRLWWISAGKSGSSAQSVPLSGLHC